MAFCLTFSQKLFAQVILHVEHLLVRATNNCSEYLGDMTKMAVKRCPLVDLDLLGLHQNQMSDELGH